MELLLDHGADVNDVHHNEYGAMSVLYGAAGASLDARDPDGLTPYARAARLKSEEAMRQLEAAGARTELDLAAE